MTQLFMTHPGPLDHAEPVLPNDLRMREATEADTADLADALTDAFEEIWSTDRVQSALLGPPDVPRTWVITAGTRIVATASERVLPKYPDAGYLHWVGVRREARGQSLGRIVTVACLRGFTERGLDRAVLETEVFRRAAVRTYLRLGSSRNTAPRRNGRHGRSCSPRSSLRPAPRRPAKPDPACQPASVRVP